MKSAEQVAYNDKDWRALDLPHDWSIEDIPGTSSPFQPDAISGVSGGFTTGGTGWYRKIFTLPVKQKSKKVFIQFDGVYMNADLWLNGDSLGKHPYGYTSFEYDITDKIKWGGKNVLVVRVKNEGRNSRWYSGSGIYRNVWLKILNPVHVAQWGTSITSSNISTSSAIVNIKTDVRNESAQASGVRLVTTIIDKNGQGVATVESHERVGADDKNTFNQNLSISSPQLWSIDSPVLYRAVTQVYVNNKLSDSKETSFGVRSISFDAENGFLLNGKSLKLKGGCVHHDNGPLGSRAYDRAEERRVELLKKSGYNAIRTSHNPPSPAFLDACDRLGMLVIDEAFDMWKDKKNVDDYHLYFNEWWKTDIESMVLRDRNHPSIIMWSTGNEIPKRESPGVAAVSQMLTDYIHSIDPTRPVTSGVNGVGEDKDPLFKTIDIAGYNYAIDKYIVDHIRVPGRVIYSSESFPLQAFDYWMAVEDHPWVIGDFVWTAFDYIGEASIGWLGYPQNKNFYPWNLAYCGDLDICGWKRPQSFYRDVLWKKDQLSVFVRPPVPTFEETNPKLEVWSKWNWQDVVADWSWKGHEGKPLEVSVYSSCDEVELFLNGRSLGKNGTYRLTQFKATWQVPYAEGELKAVGYTNGKVVNTTVLQSAGQPVGISLTADRDTIKANGQDLSYVTVEFTDAKGIKQPKAEDLIQFQIEGPGTIVGVGNANPKSTESCLLSKRKAWQGRALVIIKSNRTSGKITLKATAQDMKPAEVVIYSK